MGYSILSLGSDLFEVRGKTQKKTFYVVNLKTGCSCNKKNCNHIKAVRR